MVREFLHMILTDLRDRDVSTEYDRATAQGTKDIIQRYARNNVLFQNGAIIDDSALKTMSAFADKAIARVKAAAYPQSV